MNLKNIQALHLCLLTQCSEAELKLLYVSEKMQKVNKCKQWKQIWIPSMFHF